MCVPLYISGPKHMLDNITGDILKQLKHYNDDCAKQFRARIETWLPLFSFLSEDELAPQRFECSGFVVARWHFEWEIIYSRRS